MKNKLKILITGSSGFIGTYFYQRFKQDDWDVLGIDIRKPSTHQNFKQIDIKDKKLLEKNIKIFSPEIVIHLAARTDLGVNDSIENFKDNTLGTKNIVDICNSTNSVKKLIFTSTILVCPVSYNPKSDTEFNPQNPYGRSKVYGEKYIRKTFKKSWIILRPTSIWGPSLGSNYEGFFRRIFNKSYFNIYGNNPKITFGFLGNFYYQIKCLINNKDSIFNVFYIGDYEPVCITSWSEIINSYYFPNKKVKIKKLPFIIFKIAALLGDFMAKFGIFDFPINSYRLSNMTHDRIYKLGKIKKIAPNLPFNLSQASSVTVNWYKQNNN